MENGSFLFKKHSGCVTQIPSFSTKAPISLPVAANSSHGAPSEHWQQLKGAHLSRVSPLPGHSPHGVTGQHRGLTEYPTGSLWVTLQHHPAQHHPGPVKSSELFWLLPVSLLLCLHFPTGLHPDSTNQYISCTRTEASESVPRTPELHRAKAYVLVVAANSCHSPYFWETFNDLSNIYCSITDYIRTW